jgi:hypothetical protein
MGTYIGVNASTSYIDTLVGSSILDLDLGTNVLLLLCSPVKQALQPQKYFNSRSGQQ